MSSAAVPVEIIPGNANAIPGSGEKPFAFPPESLFAISPESRSSSPRNRFRVHPGIPFALPRNPQWAEDWSQSRIDASRVDDRRTKDKYYGVGEKEAAMPPKPGTPPSVPQKAPWWRKLLPW
jgi:hypothetical protein